MLKDKLRHSPTVVSSHISIARFGKSSHLNCEMTFLIYSAELCE